MTIYATKGEAATGACIEYKERNTWIHDLDHYKFSVDGNGVESGGFQCVFGYLDQDGQRQITTIGWWGVHSTLDKCGAQLHYDVVTGQCVQNIIEKTIEKKSLGSPSCDLNTQAGKDN